jgi:hypothetical protein
MFVIASIIKPTRMFFLEMHHRWVQSGQRSMLAALSVMFLASGSAGGQALTSQSQVSSVQTSASSETKSLELEHIVHIVGLEGLKPNITGHLVFDSAKMTFTAGETSVSVPLQSIRAFSFTRDSVALIGGTKGKIAGMAPYGVGQVITAIRPTAGTLTLLYVDKSQAVHGCILIVPKEAEDSLTTTLAKEKVSSSEYPKSGQWGLTMATSEIAVQNSAASDANPKPSVVVSLLTESVDGIPSAFPIAEYEELIAQLTDSGMFAKVWREGDVHRNPNALVLKVNIEDLKKGSARSRGLVPFTGATVIKTQVSLLDMAGHTLYQADIEGAKRMRGENLDATSGLAKKVKKELQKAPGLKAHT